MTVEDLQQIIAETSHKLQGRKMHLLLAGVGIFIIVTLLALLIGIIYMGATSCGGYSSLTGMPRDVCVTPGCLKVSAFLSKNMDSSVDACDNFYQFACGGWIQKAGIPTEYSVVDISTQLEFDSEQKWKAILESRSVSSDDDSIEWKVKTFFKLCLHDYGRMKEGGRKLVDMLRHIMGEWYVFDPDNWQSAWNLDDAIVMAHKEYMLPVFFDYWVWPDARDSTRNIITVYPAFLGMSTYDYENEAREHLRDVYRTYIRTLGYYLIRDSGLAIDNATATTRLDQFVDDIMDIETRLARIKRQAGRIRWWGSHFTPLRQMGRNFTQVDYVDILTHLFRDADVTVSTEISVLSTNYYQLLDDLLEDEGEDKDRIINNFIAWTVASNAANYMSWEYRYAKYAYLEARWGMTEFPTTWETCMRLVRYRFAEALAVIFYKKHIGDNLENHVEHLSDTIKATLMADVDTIPWMDNATKPHAKQKVKKMSVNVGIPPEYRDGNQVNRLFSHLNVDPDESFYQNLIYLNEFALYKASRRLSTTNSNNVWRYAVYYNRMGVRPYYFWWYNAALIPTGAMQFPIYGDDAPMVYNYGAMGTRLANSVVHSIDSVGSKFANKTFSIWWSQETRDNYERTSQCVHDYYGNQTAGPYVIDGEQKTTRVEGQGYEVRAVGRMAGLRIAYQSYEKWAKTNYERRLPGMNMTNEQLFFLTAIQTRCAVQSDESAYDRAKSGYLPAELLMNGLVSHSTDFARIFKCPAGSKMNPAKKCRVF